LSCGADGLGASFFSEVKLAAVYLFSSFFSSSTLGAYTLTSSLGLGCGFCL
jgi:hypothetical protein